MRDRGLKTKRGTKEKKKAWLEVTEKHEGEGMAGMAVVVGGHLL